jgi:DNA polymerase elongation subunit (family B)
MGFVNVHYDTRKSKMHLWEEIKGRRFYDCVEWVPYVYLRSSNSPIKTIYGETVTKKEFATYQEYHNFLKEDDGLIAYENRVKPEIQFLAERYHQIPDDQLEVPKLRIYTLDIEVLNSEGFPDVRAATDPISLISILDSQSKKVVSFGCKPYTGDQPVVFRHYSNEAEMILRFLNFLNKRPPDVITGWNVYYFDLAYLINRCRTLFGEETQHIKKLSPIRNVRTWVDKYGEMNIDIAGVHIIDYLDAYKWYAPKKLERYKLDFVAMHELGEGKVDYSEYRDLRELYEMDWNKYVLYNNVDCKRVDQLEDQLGYIRLIQALSLLTKCPMKYYQAMTHLIEGALITHFRRNDLCAPYLAGGRQEHFEAAFVKEPQKGMHEWIIDIDIASSYPTAIITLNMSNETYYGRIMEFQDNTIVDYVRKREFPPFDLNKDGRIIRFTGTKLDNFNRALARGLFAIAPCGSVFKTTQQGEIAKVEKAIFFKRKDVKNKMKEFRNMYAEIGDVKFQERENELFSLQWAIKILLNAMFGITAVPYSRYFNTNIAEAITSCGRHTIRMGEKFVNEWFQQYAGMDDDMVAYIDTDSLFIRLGHYFTGMDDWENGDDASKIKLILDFSKQLEKYVNERSYQETQKLDYNSQVDDFKIFFEQEIVAKRALFVKKKKYAYWMVNKEGTPVDELAVKGLEIVRSDSAEAIRTRLKNVYELIMRGTPDKELVDIISKYKRELKKVPPEEISANMTVNGISKYLEEGKPPVKGTPWHVKGVYNWRLLMDKFDLWKEYEDIYEGNKARIVYLKRNKFNIDVLTYDRWPRDVDMELQVDYDKMIEKFFLKKISFLLEPMGKLDLLSADKESAVDSFFC